MFTNSLVTFRIRKVLTLRGIVVIMLLVLQKASQLVVVVRLFDLALIIQVITVLIGFHLVLLFLMF